MPQPQSSSVRERRRAAGFITLSICLAIAWGVCGEQVSAHTSLWECNWCHQQYQGNQAPAFAKCPAKDMKQNHWWIKKS
ncbi:MAG: hypothetical protein WCO90_00960 [Planctomycetota bacterium]